VLARIAARLSSSAPASAADTGPARPPTTSKTMDGALWQRLVNERGWSDEQFQQWLTRMWVATLVSDEMGSRRIDVG
jgi:hypothetical protein